MVKKEEVLHIARLARLDLPESELKRYQDRLSKVLGYIEQLKELDLKSEAFVKHVPKDAVGLREDKAIAFASIEALMANAPEVEEHAFSIPTVVEHEA